MRFGKKKHEHIHEPNTGHMIFIGPGESYTAKLGVVPAEEGADLSNTAMSCDGGRRVTLTSKTGAPIPESSSGEQWIVDPSYPINYAGNTKQYVQRAGKCALFHMGEGATANVHIEPTTDRYITRSKPLLAQENGVVMQAVTETHQLELVCKDATGNDCPIAERCKYVAAFATEQMHITGHIIFVPLVQSNPFPKEVIVNGPVA
jgi:hypothetical protein